MKKLNQIDDKIDIKQTEKAKKIGNEKMLDK